MRRGTPSLQQATVLVGLRGEEAGTEATESLGRRGLGVELAATDGEILAAVARERPNLVLLAFDHMEGDGFALCRALARRREGEPVPVLVAADASDGRVIESAYAAGATDFIPTPINWPLLGHRARQLLRSSYAITELNRARASLETLQQVAGLGSWTWTQESGHMQWSDKVYAILGLEDEGVETNIEGFTLCMHPEDRDFTQSMIEAAVRSGRSFDVPLRVIQPSGAVRHVQIRGALQGPKRVSGTMQDVTEERRAQEKINYLAHYDSLTGLANRRRFMEQLERARREAAEHQSVMALLYMDLDQFKRINDTLGHGAGDELLRSVAETLFDQVRSTDVVGRTGSRTGSEVSRLGGDEFAILLTQIGSRDDAEGVARRILAAVPTPIAVESQEISATASIGIAVYPDDGEDVETLVKHADRAMYFAKENGRNNYEFFSDTMNVGSMRRLTLETHLRAAVEKQAMHVQYQPRIVAASHAIEGAEALLRWNDEELGAVSPKEFIPLAEETGLIKTLGEWVLHEACQQLQRWRERGVPRIRMSVNVSTHQLADSSFAQLVADALRAADVFPGDLELEITESAMLEDDQGTASILRDIRDMGVRIALDDFGTGYSSLSYLERFPLDTLKLDRSLVRDVTSSPSAQGIVQAVISMAHALGLTVVAEGVDAEEQLRLLGELGCDEIQGFLISGALDPDVLAEKLASRDGEDLPGLGAEEAEADEADLPGVPESDEANLPGVADDEADLPGMADADEADLPGVVREAD